MDPGYPAARSINTKEGAPVSQNRRPVVQKGTQPTRPADSQPNGTKL